MPFSQSSSLWSRSGLRIILMAVLVAGFPHVSLGETEQAPSPTIGQLGTVEFSVSGSPRAHPHFLRGVAALHSFWYEEAIDAFRRATAIDPTFAMGYWGEAMAHNHPIWEEENVEAARAALLHIPDEASVTPRERRYIQAVQTLFGQGSKAARDQAYAAEMERLAGEYPEDREATCFYALSLLGLAMHFDDEPDIQEKYRVQAGALTLGVYRLNPDHPCAAHYTIHAFDDSIHAILALPQARRYAEIAPEAPHAQHMPAHIFLQLGMWDKAAASNKNGWESSRAWVKKKQLPLALQDYHSLYWLHYVFLQQGRYQAAQAVLADKQRDMAQSPSGEQGKLDGYDRRVSRNYDQMVAAYIVETERWEEADRPWKVNGYRFGDEAPLLATYVRALAEDLQKLANQSSVHKSQAETASSFSEKNLPSPEPSISGIWALQLDALNYLVGGNQAEALKLLNQAVVMEDRLPPPSGPPDLLKPTHELYGEILLFLNKPEEAQRHFKRTLLWHTNRARSLLGLGRAASQTGNLDTARYAYGTLVLIWDQADPELPELQEAKEFLLQMSHQ